MSFLAPLSSVFPAGTAVRSPINSRVRRWTVHHPSAAMMCLVAHGAERRRAWRQLRRRMVRGFVVLTMTLSLLSQQTGALAEVERRMYEPARISLRPGMFALAGPYQYHGSDRYETDLIDMDKLLRPDGGQPAPGAGRSTGFVHVGVRYYEPATGRFLQHDPMFIDPTPFMWGQHNRWVYCANDPVNGIDSAGSFLQVPFAVWMGVTAGLLGIGWANTTGVWSQLFGTGASLCSIAGVIAESPALQRLLILALFRMTTAAAAGLMVVMNTLVAGALVAAPYAELALYYQAAITAVMWALFESGSAWVG